MANGNGARPVRSDDPKTVTIKPSSPWPTLPLYFAQIATAIYPADFAGHDEAYMHQHPISTGPLKLESWSKGQSVVIEKNAILLGQRPPEDRSSRSPRRLRPRGQIRIATP